MGRIAPLHSSLEFRLVGNDSLLLLLVHLCLGDNHTPSHLTSLPQIRPDAHFAKGGDSPPHKRPRLPVEFRLMMSANPLQLTCYQTRGGGGGDKRNCRPAPLALLLDYIMSKFPVASKPLARLSNRIPDSDSSDYGRISSAGLLQPDEQEGNKENCLPASLALLLGYIMSKFPAASKPLAWLSNRLPDENLSDHSHNSSAGLLQMDEEEGDVKNCCPSSLALLLD